MIQSLHIDAHLDAETVTSFLECSLLERERETVLNHLADCERCREVTWFAQEAAADSAPASSAPVPLVREMAKRAGDIPRWRFSLVSGVALAASLTIVIAVIARRPLSPQMIARDVPELPRIGPVSKPTESKNDPVSKPVQPLRNKEHVELSRRSTGRGAEDALHDHSLGTRAIQGGIVAEGQPHDPTGAATAATHDALTPPLNTDTSVRAPAFPAAAHVTTPPPAVKFGDTSAEVVAKIGRPTTVELLKDRNIYRYPGQSITLENGMVSDIQSAVATQQALGEKPGGVINPSSQSKGGFGIVSAVAGIASSSLFGAVRLNRGLPSGLPPVSAISAEDLILALDSAGNVFRSSNEGRNWEAIAVQWTGNAKRIRRAAPGDSAKTTGSVPGEVVSFELINDAGSVWTTKDGRAWKPK